MAHTANRVSIFTNKPTVMTFPLFSVEARATLSLKIDSFLRMDSYSEATEQSDPKMDARSPTAASESALAMK